MKTELFQDILHLVFPEFCAACEKPLYKNEKCICTRCLNELPKTGFSLDDHNAVAARFWGKTKIHSAFALYYFDKGEKVQKLLHQFKYKGKREIGLLCGEICGQQIEKSESSNNIDYIIPVPLHPSKQRVRGFNQSYSIAQGINNVLNKELLPETLIRKVATSSQTKKHRYSRYENMKDVFSINNPLQIKNKHILLVDDVITTGSTLTSCAELLIKETDVTISIASLAFANNK